jgi:hypothetical protein
MFCYHDNTILQFFKWVPGWFSLSTPASSTTKTGRHDIAEILLKVALKHQKSNQNQSRIANAVLVIGLYELLGNPTI